MSATLSIEELTLPALLPPLVNTSPRLDRAGMGYGMTIGIERTSQGRIWACRVAGGDDDTAYMVLNFSDDDGLTWSGPQTTIDPHDARLSHKCRSLVGNLWTDPGGRLWLFFDQAMSFFDGRAGTWFTRCDLPDAGNPVWTQPERIWHGCSLNKPIVLSGGEWLLPVSLWNREKISHPFQESFLELDEVRGANVLGSSDGGATWKRLGGVRFPHPDFDEPVIVEKKDGTLWMTARTLDLDVWESFSSDKGATWTVPRASLIKNVNARHWMRRLASGRILLLKHGESVDVRTYAEKPYRGRSHLTAFLSEDEGLSWKGGLVLDERLPVSYPDGFQAPDGHIYISYDHNRQKVGEVSHSEDILLAKFREEDVFTGSFQSPDSWAKRAIFRSSLKAP